MTKRSLFFVFAFGTVLAGCDSCKGLLGKKEPDAGAATEAGSADVDSGEAVPTADAAGATTATTAKPVTKPKTDGGAGDAGDSADAGGATAASDAGGGGAAGGSFAGTFRCFNNLTLTQKGLQVTGIIHTSKTVETVLSCTVNGDTCKGTEVATSRPEGKPPKVTEDRKLVIDRRPNGDVVLRMGSSEPTFCKRTT